MKILLLSFYFPPDLSAGSFRTAALVKALMEQLPENVELELITTLPNRYNSFSSEALEIEKQLKLTIHRIALPPHKSGMLDQAKAFFIYALRVLTLTRDTNYQLVYGTSSRLMTAVLSAYISARKCAPLYLDIRDIFADTIKDVLSRKIGALTKSFFLCIESWTIRRANIVNLVSPGFKQYFDSRFPTNKFSFYTNGIDSEFISAGVFEQPTCCVAGKAGLPLVLYAGNIGEGQGLHVIIPELAKHFEGVLRFRLIGDGGRKDHLLNRLTEVGCNNVEVVAPISRAKLISEYQQADVLFLHLNDYDAFKKVLPSKVFEYAATGKPIWAGVSGYSAEFIRDQVKNSVVFNPCALNEGIRVFEQLRLEFTNRSDFIKKYTRESIMHDMASDILSLLPIN